MPEKLHIGVEAAIGDSAGPFLKWAGGKQWLAARLAKAISSGTGTYYEAFLGGGAAFFAARPKKAVLSDSNRRLIETYEAIRDTPELILRYLSEFKYQKRQFTRVRSATFKSKARRAAQFIYLNRTCWNGLYRVNREGEFNVPFGQFAYPPTIRNAGQIRAVSQVLKGMKLQACDFALATKNAVNGDVVFFDPPYTVCHDNNGFIRYNEKLFAWSDQKRLAKTAKKLADKGVTVLVTNACHSTITALYPGFHKTVLTRRQLLAADAGRRSVGREILFSSVPLTEDENGKGRAAK